MKWAIHHSKHTLPPPLVHGGYRAYKYASATRQDFNKTSNPGRILVRKQGRLTYGNTTTNSSHTTIDLKSTTATAAFITARSYYDKSLFNRTWVPHFHVATNSPRNRWLDYEKQLMKVNKCWSCHLCYTSLKRNKHPPQKGF